MSDGLDLQKAEAALATSGLNQRLLPSEVERIRTFLALRTRWSKAHNLSGPKAHRDPWLLDVNDAVALRTVLRPDLQLFDVGSGSGVPGLILKLLVPELPMVLVEPLSKRVAFLKTVIHQFKLSDIKVERGRWPLNGSQPCQIVSRAVVSPETWPRLADEGPHVLTIYRYLALSRPEFSTDGFELNSAVDYQRAHDEALRLERWDRL